jgi:hypothetical protein
MLQLAAIFSVHCAMTLRGAMVTIRTKRTRSERVNAQCVTHGPDGAPRDAPRPSGGAYLCPWLTHIPSLARGQVTPLLSQRGQGDARPARYGQKRCRCMRSTTAGNQSASWRAGPAGHPAPSAALRCALGPALSASGTGRTWCTTRAARRPGQPNGTWPGRCWRGRAVALRGIEPVHSLGRRPSREHGRHHGLWDGVTGTHAAPPIWTGGDSSAIASRGAQIGLFRAPASPGSGSPLCQEGGCSRLFSVSQSLPRSGRIWERREQPGERGGLVA